MGSTRKPVEPSVLSRSFQITDSTLCRIYICDRCRMKVILVLEMLSIDGRGAK